MSQPTPLSDSAFARMGRKPVSAAAAFATGFGFSVLGFKLAFSKRLRRWTLAPLALNVLLFAAGACLFFWGVQRLLHRLVGDVDRWYEYIIAALVWASAPLIFGLLLFFTFVLLVNALAAPFADILSEKTEALLRGQPLDETFRVMQFAKDIVVGMVHAVKLLALQLVVLFVGLIPVIGPPMAIAGTAILLTLEYIDYPMTRRRRSFRDKRKLAFGQAWKSAGFGCGALLWMLMPVVNFVCVPAAVCGGTALFLDLDKRNAPDGTHSPPAPSN